MVVKLVSVCSLERLPEGRPRRVVAPDGTPLVCVRRGSDVDVLDDRCPHEGHPLSQGMVRDRTITCAWHEWRFDLASGECLQGEEGTQRFDAEVHHGQVFVDLHPSVTRRVRRAVDDLHRSLHRRSLAGALRAALRLDTLDPTGGRARREALAFVSEHAPDGVGDVLVSAAAAHDLRRDGVIDEVEANAITLSATVAACVGRPLEGRPPSVPSQLGEAEHFLSALIEGRGAEASARVRGLPKGTRASEVIRAWLLPFASIELWNLGAVLPQLAALATLDPYLEPELGRSLTASVAGAMATAFAPSRLPTWMATRQAMMRLRSIARGVGDPLDAADFVHAMLVSEREATHRAVEALARGEEPAVLLRALSEAACTRLAGFVAPRRGGLVHDVLEAGRALLFIDAARALDDGRSSWALAHVVLAAGFVGKLRRHQGDIPPTPVRPCDLDGLREALERRDAPSARRCLGEGNPAALRELVRFGALRARGEGASAAALAAALWRHHDTRDAGVRASAGLRAFVETRPPDLTDLARRATEAVRRAGLRDG